MIDRSHFNAEDFLVDNTFQLYCAGQDKRCMAFWEAYIKAHPEQIEVIEEAKRLYVILSGNKKPLNTQIDKLKASIESEKNLKEEVAVVSIRKKYSWLKIAAAILIVAGVAAFLYTNIHPKETLPIEQEYVSHFSSKEGERKKITLSDGSTVLLNFRSSLSLHKDFNKNTREVELIGEAFFDVAKNKDKPFVVHTSDFDINVLGTSFNVKVYPEDATSEAVLIEGLIVMEPKVNEGSSITMKPSQKVTFYKTKPFLPANQKVISKIPQVQEIAINQYTQNEDNSIAEMAWTQNRLEIMDESFGDLKNELERWYNVQINFNDKEVEGYRFTATFANKNIKEVLNALQKAKHFNYEIKENQIMISR